MVVANEVVLAVCAPSDCLYEIVWLYLLFACSIILDVSLTQVLLNHQHHQDNGTFISILKGNKNLFLRKGGLLLVVLLLLMDKYNFNL